MKHKINIDEVPEKYRFMVKEEMTNSEISELGIIIMKEKIANFKRRISEKFKKSD